MSDHHENDAKTDHHHQAQEHAQEQEQEHHHHHHPSPHHHHHHHQQPFELPNEKPSRLFAECRSVSRFEKIGQIGEGTYGQVFMARDKDADEHTYYALKKVRMENEKEGFPITAMREVTILFRLKHPNIVNLLEIVVGSKVESVFLVFEYCEHDLSGLLDNLKTPFKESEIKCIMLQLLSAVDYLHDRWVLHRDIKMSNLLLMNDGTVKLADFGLAREFGNPLKPYTQRVVTLWYRAPELLLGCTVYSTAIDMWSVGCIFGEFLQHSPLLPGKTEIQQLSLIFNLLGTPTPKIWPGFTQLPEAEAVRWHHQPYNNVRSKFDWLTEEGLDLFNKLFTYDPERRVSARDALKHRYFREQPLPKDKSLMPTFPQMRGQEYRDKRKNDCKDEEPSASKQPMLAYKDRQRFQNF